MPKAFGTPGPRAIYPDVCTSRSLASVSPDAEALFFRLITQADDQGRIEGDQVIVKALCVPLRPKMTVAAVNRSLDELVAEKLIVRYQVERSHLVQIVTWWRWQAGMRRAYESRWPAPDGWDDVVFGHGGDGPKTYREAAELPRGARNLPAASPQPAGSVPAASPQVARSLPASRARGAHAVPVPSAGAGAGADSESGDPTVESRPPAAERPSGSNTWEKAIDVAARLAAADEQGPEAFHLALSKSDLDAWSTFGHEWDDLKAAWIERGLRHPPSGAVDEEGSQRQMLYEILDNWPSRIVEWTKEAPAGASARAVIAHVIARRDEERGEQLAYDDERDASWKAEKDADRESAPEVLRRVARA